MNGKHKVRHHDPLFRLDDGIFSECCQRSDEQLSAFEVDCTPGLWELLKPQSIWGHALNGHIGFRRKNNDGSIDVFQFPNATLEDVVQHGLGRDVDGELYRRDRIIGDIHKYLNLTYQFEKQQGQPQRIDELQRKNNFDGMLLNKEGQPLGGHTLFWGTSIRKPALVALGFWLGVMYDSALWRNAAAEKYGVDIHAGDTVIVSKDAMHKHGITIQDLSNMGYLKKIPFKVDKRRLKRDGPSYRDLVIYETLHDIGIIVTLDNSVMQRNRRIQLAYLETRKGWGGSDDAAFLTISLFYGLEAGWGFILADAVDTWEKGLPDLYNHGRDMRLAENLDKRYKFSQEIDPLEIMGILRNACKFYGKDNGSERLYFPSSSQRRFMERDPHTHRSAIISHVNEYNKLVQRGPKPLSMRLAFDRILNGDFYHVYEANLMEFMTEKNPQTGMTHYDEMYEAARGRHDHMRDLRPILLPDYAKRNGR